MLHVMAALAQQKFGVLTNSDHIAIMVTQAAGLKLLTANDCNHLLS